ncbi:putative Smu-1 suppressor of mec-8 and unc-52 protein [Blattamonas nauphoetae]|uniref:Smu-1 suppressor of mec-8 and unc-52 protein n=1 Tax=Blattamonas nauphoetae TaxID=2049346 RepID=A0ABQ9YES4_9EUKA|nr:putative Smu-1 suppressor of mec-8 and unc-52 protein [Blattamonas nauphoetae]
MKESQTVHNTTVDPHKFLNDMKQGKWELVLPQLETLQFPPDLVGDVYEQLLIDLIDSGERQVAELTLKRAEPLLLIKKENRQRYRELEEHFISPTPIQDKKTRDQKRDILSTKMSEHLLIGPRSRLLNLVGHALQWENHVGLLTPSVTRGDDPYNLFLGSSTSSPSIGIHAARKRKKDGPVVDIYKIFDSKKDPDASVESASSLIFTPDGTNLVAGTASGNIYSFNFETGLPDTRLEYQKNGIFLDHPGEGGKAPIILSLAFSLDGEILASGDSFGCIRIWQYKTGIKAREVTSVGVGTISSLVFNKTGGRLFFAGSTSRVVKVYALDTDRVVRDVLVGQWGGSSLSEARITSLLLSRAKANEVLVGFSNGKVETVDVKTCEVLLTQPIQQIVSEGGRTNQIDTASILRLCHDSKHRSRFVVFGGAHSVEVVATTGGVVKRWIVAEQKTPETRVGRVLDGGVGRDGNWATVVCDDGIVRNVDLEKGEVVTSTATLPSMPVALARHPTMALVAISTARGQIVVFDALSDGEEESEGKQKRTEKEQPAEKRPATEGFSIFDD